jgi:PKD repeat protein
MSDDSRFLFLPYFNHLRILHPQTKTQIVEFNFDNDLISYGYNIENNGLISLTKSNTIELRYPKELVDSIDFKTSLMVTYQNVQISYFYSGIPKYKKYKWDFGDGKTSNEWLPTHSYSKTGEYSVKLTITDSLGIETTVIKDKFIRIIDTLVADFTILYQDPKDKHFVMFRDKTKGEVKTIKWDFGDGKIDSINNPVHRYEYEGFYKVTLFVSDEFSSDTISNIISVFDTPPSFCSDPNIRQVRYIKSITCRTSNGFVNLFKISNLGNYYLNYMYGYENNSCYGFQFTIFDKDLNQKYYNDNSTIKDFIFENNDENIRYFNNNSILIADKFLSKIDTVKSNIYFEYWYSDRYGNTFGLKKPSDDDWTLNKYNKFGNFIWSYIIPKYKSVPNIRTNENYVYFSFLNSYETYSKRYFHRLSNEGNLIDQFEIQELNWNRRNFHFDIITSQKSTSIYIVLTAFNDSTFIYKFDDQNKLIKSFQIKNFNFSAAKFINSDFSILGLIGKTAISGFMLIDTNLNIIYNRRFINLKNNIDNLALNERNEIVLVAPFFEEWYVTFNFITDTLPKWIIDKYLTSVQNPRLSNEIIQVLPNPASDDVEFILPEDPISGTFEIYNQQSQKVFSQNEVSDRLNLNTQIFPTGVYFCVFRTKDKVILQKFMVVH